MHTTDHNSLLARRVLLIDPTRTLAQSFQCEALCAWSVDTVSTLSAAREQLIRTQPRTALITFVDEETEIERHFEPSLYRPSIEWVALVTRGALQREAVRDLLLRAFFDHHTLPLDPTRLGVTLGHAWGRAQLANGPPAAATIGRFGMTGQSPAMQKLYRDIERIARTDAPVLIGGESGTGKELVARAIARHSRRAKGSFIAINCAAIAPSLIHSELFGHEKGAFTGAVSRKIGSIEAADRGVLLLDEIGDLPLELQAHLLRFLQERTITRLGSVQAITVDVRIIAATHVDLVEAIKQQRFREDLYYRLNVLGIEVPTLRSRDDDVLLLARELLKEANRKHPHPARGFSAGARFAMQQHPWPGNVRELINRIQRAAVMCDARLIEAEDLGLHTPPPIAPTLDQARLRIERETIENTLRRHAHNISRTARTLGVSRMTLYRMMNRLNICA